MRPLTEQSAQPSVEPTTHVRQSSELKETELREYAIAPTEVRTHSCQSEQ